MLWGVEIAALIAIPVAGYIGAVALLNRAANNIAEDFTDWSSDPRTFGLAGLLGGGRAAANGGGGAATEQATRPESHTNEAIARLHNGGL